MIAIPSFLFSIGILLIVLGAVSNIAFKPREFEGPEIDEQMSDEEIASQLRRRPPLGVPNRIVFAGLFCLIISATWRLLRVFF
jgi:hypothetical protein